MTTNEIIVIAQKLIEDKSGYTQKLVEADSRETMKEAFEYGKIPTQFVTELISLMDSTEAHNRKAIANNFLTELFISQGW